MSPRPRVKVVPPVPDDRARLADVRAALPLVPDDEESCCARLLARADVPAQDEAREWLTFLAALGLADETERGFRRVRDDPDEAALGEAFLERVYGARELLSVLEAADGPLGPDAAFERFREAVPAWERRHHADAERVWRERVERLLGWAALFGLVERDERGGFVRSG